MGLIQVCSDDEDSDLAKMETVGDARRKKYLAKGIARAKAREEQMRRPASAMTTPRTTSSLSSDVAAKAARCISACTNSTTQAKRVSGTGSEDELRRTARAVAAATTQSTEPNLSDTLYNTITSDMSILRRHPSHSIHYRPPSKQSPAPRPVSAAAAMAAAATPAATLPRNTRPVSAACPNRSAYMYPDLLAAPPAHLDTTNTQHTTSTQPSTSSPSSPTRASQPPSTAHTPSASQPPSLSARPSTAHPHSQRSLPSFPSQRPSTAHPHNQRSQSPSPSQRPSTAHPHNQRSQSPTLFSRPATAHRTSIQRSSSLSATAGPSKKAPTLFRPPRPASAIPSHTPQPHSTDDATPPTHSPVSTSHAPAQQPHLVRGRSAHHSTQLSVADVVQQSMQKSGPSITPRALPQWHINSQPMTDMLQSQRTEKDGFPLPGADDAPWKGQNAQASLSVNLFAFGPKKEEELPVGVVAHTVYVAQTTGNVDGLRDRRISNLPYQVFNYLKNEGKLLPGTLDVSHNHLTSLPFLQYAPSINSLLVSHNRIFTLPPSAFSPLTCLQTLDLSHNTLQTLPSSLGGLGSLKHLDASHNNLEVLPSSFSQLKSLVSLKVDHNNLFCLPCGTSRLTALEHLSAKGNQMTGLPPNLGSCTRLSVLDLRQNSLTALPSSLKGLHPFLLQMHLDDNDFSVLPREVALLTNLTSLTLLRNPLLFPPYEVAKEGVEVVQQFLSIYSTPGLNNSSHTASCGTPAVHSHHPVAQGAAEQGAAGPGSTPSQGTCIIPNGALKKKEAVGYVSREITTEDVLDATLESCQSYNPQQQGSLLLHMQYEAEELRRQMAAMQLEVNIATERAEKAERDSAELADTLRSKTLEVQPGTQPRPGTLYEQNSAELARAVRILEADLREAQGELKMAHLQLGEARSMEAQQRRLADAAIRDAEEAGHAVQRCKELEDELEAAKAREAELNRKILKVLDDNREFEDRCLKAESKFDTALLGKHHVTQIELQQLKKHIVVTRLETSAAQEAAAAQEAHLQERIKQLEASLLDARTNIRDVCVAQEAAARVQERVKAAEVSGMADGVQYAQSFEQVHAKQRHAVLAAFYGLNEQDDVDQALLE